MTIRTYLSVILTGILALTFSTSAQTNITSIQKVDDGLYLMYYGKTSEKASVTKSTVVEFRDYLVLMEMPISNDGAGAVHLTDHTEGGEQVIQKLKEFFPGKPLKYVLSTHWHPHSISSIIPFISRGITVVTTRKNFSRLSEFVDSTTFAAYHDYIRFVETDSMVIADGPDSVIAYKFDKADYPSVPTQDFLYFYLPKYRCLHCSCMFQRLRGALVKGKELVSGRVEDLNRFIESRKIAPRHFICTDILWDEDDGMTSGDTLQALMRNGITMSSVEQDLLNISEETLLMKSDSIIGSIMTDNIPVNSINRAIYTALERKDLQKALALARIQALLVPSDPNAWDTFGEVYYVLGNMQLAKRYEMQSRRIDKDFNIGGETVWEKDLKDFQKRWENR